MKLSRKLPLAAAIAAIITASGCTTVNSTGDMSANTNEISARTAALDERERSLTEREQSLASRATAIDSSVPAASTSNTGDLLPPNAKSGECYARAWVPPTYRTVNESVLAKEASSSIQVIPAVYEWQEESVLVQEASSRLVNVPAIYGTETETIKISDAQRIWRTGLERKSALASDDLLATAAKHGIDLDSAEIGQCFHEHYRPATYGTETQDVLVSEASKAISVTPAKYRTVEKRIMVKEASFKLVDVPATYKTVSEKVLDKPAHTIWKKGKGPIQRIDDSTGEIMCLVDIPATYKIVTKRVTVTPATTKRLEIPAEYKSVKVRELVEDAVASSSDIPEKHKTVTIRTKLTDPEFVWHEVHTHGEPTDTRTGLKVCLTEIPAKYKTVKRRVVKQPANFKKVEIPAEYKTIKSRKLVTEAKEVRTDLPEQYKTITRQELVTDGHMEWRSIICETNMTKERIRQIQLALKDEGFDPVTVDGVVGENTIRAINEFQKAKGLPVDRYINIETVRALGVSPK